MPTLLVLGILKTTVLSVLFCILSIVFDNHSLKMFFNNCVEGEISECLFNTAHKTPCAQKVEILKLLLSTYNSFFTGEALDDACECLMLLIEIMGKGLPMTIYLVRGRFLTPIFIRFRKNTLYMTYVQ